MSFVAISLLPTPPCLSSSTRPPSLLCHSSFSTSIKPSHFLPTHLPFHTSRSYTPLAAAPPSASTGGTGGDNNNNNNGRGDNDDGADADRNRNRAEAILALAEAGRSLETLPNDLSLAVQAGRIPASILHRYFHLHNSTFFRWLLNFRGFKERLLADDLFLTKLAIECGIGIFTKSAAELEKRKQNFRKELDFVTADVIMALVADFMLVWLPAPTIPLRPALAISVGPVARFFYACPDNAFQIAFGGTKYSLLQRVGALVRNGAKLFAVGTSASVIGTGVTNLLINVRKGIDKSFAAEAEDIPMLATSIAYGTYMSVSANLRYQIIAGVIEQRLLEPLLHQQKLALSAICFVVRTGNTFLGSLMWVDFARLIGVQRARD